MNSDFLAKLMAASAEDRPWLLMESVLESLSVELRWAVWAMAVPHWFDAEILAVLCPELAIDAERLYEELQALSFVERFGDRGFNVHEATRTLLLDRFWQDRPEEFKAISQRAADYFANDEDNPAEWLYHKAVVEPIGNAMEQVMRPFDHNYQRTESEIVLKVLNEQISANHILNASVTAGTRYWSGEVCSRFYEKSEALAHYQDAIVLYREVGDQLGEANTLRVIGDVFQFKDQRDEALAHYQDAIVLYREVGNRLGEANTLKAIGEVLQFKSQYDEALAPYQDAIVLCREVGDRLGEANTLYRIGEVLQFKSQYDEALAHYQDAIVLYREVGSRLGEANTLQVIGNVLQFKKQTDEALARYQDAIVLYREVGDRLGEANTLKAIADVLQFKDQHDEALAHYQDAIILYREVGSRLGEANTLKAIGNLQSDYNLAIQTFFQPALKIYEQIEDQYSQAGILTYSIAPTYLKLGNFCAAKTSYEQALKLWTNINYVQGINQCKRILLILNPKLWKLFIGFCIGFAIVLLIGYLRK